MVLEGAPLCLGDCGPVSSKAVVVPSCAVTVTVGGRRPTPGRGLSRGRWRQFAGRFRQPCLADQAGDLRLAAERGHGAGDVDALAADVREDLADLVHGADASWSTT